MFLKFRCQPKCRETRYCNENPLSNKIESEIKKKEIKNRQTRIPWSPYAPPVKNIIPKIIFQGDYNESDKQAFQGLS